MTDKELLYIKTIAEERNISAAAKKLFMTQPALSHCLSTLEKEMGTPLFVRTSKGLNLTYAGECYYKMAVDILDIYYDYQQKLVDISHMRKGRVHLGITKYLSALLLPQVLPEFSNLYPYVEIQIKEKNSAELEQDVLARRIDFAIIHGDEQTNRKLDSGLVCQSLFRDDFCIVMSKDNQYQKQAVRMTGYTYPVLDLKLLEGEKFILETLGHRMRNVTDALFKRVNIEPQIILETELFETAHRLASAGYGVTIINEHYLNTFTNNKDSCIYSIPKKYKPFWNICVLRCANSYMPVASQELLNMICKLK